MGMILRIASSRIVGQGDIVGRSGYFSLNLSANSVMRGRLDARRTLKSLVADLRLKKSVANLEMCEIRVNTHILTGIPRALIYLFSKRYARTETLFSGVFRPFPYSYVLFLSTFKLNDV